MSTGPVATNSSVRKGFSIRLRPRVRDRKTRHYHSLVSLKILSVLSSPSTHPDPGDKVPRILQDLKRKVQGGKRLLREAYASLSPIEKKELGERVGKSCLQAILKNSERNSEKLFWDGSLRLGKWLMDQDKLEGAQGIFGVLTGRSFKVPPKIREEARRDRDALMGRGAVGPRIAFLASRFIKQATAPGMILPMIAGSVVYQLTRTALLGRLALSPAKWWTRRWGAQFFSSLVAYTAEVPSFALMNRGWRQLNGQPLGNFTEEFFSAGISLAVLKVGFYGGTQVFRKVHGINEWGMATRLQGLTPISQVLYPQATTFMGLLAAHGIEAKMGLRPEVDGATWVVDTLSTLASLGMGSALGYRVLGKSFRQFQRGLEQSAQVHTKALRRPITPFIKGMVKDLGKGLREIGGAALPDLVGVGGGSEINLGAEYLNLAMVGKRDGGSGKRGASQAKVKEGGYSYHGEKAAEKEELARLHETWVLGGGRLLLDPEAQLREILPVLRHKEPLITLGARHLLNSDLWGAIDLSRLNEFESHYSGNLGQVELFRDLAIVLNRPRLGIDGSKKNWGKRQEGKEVYANQGWNNIPIRWQEYLWLKKQVDWSRYHGDAGYDGFATDFFQGNSQKAYRVASSLLSADEFAALAWGKQKHTPVKEQEGYREILRKGIKTKSLRGRKGLEAFSLTYFQGKIFKAYLVANSLLDRREMDALGWERPKEVKLDDL